MIAFARFYLLFLTLVLTSFEWQYIAAERFGDAVGPSFLGMAMSGGNLATLSLLFGLILSKKQLHNSRIPLALLVLHLALGWTVASSHPTIGAMLPIAAIQASLGLLAIAIETHAVQSDPTLKFEHARIGGSLGFLTAACLSQSYPGELLPWTIVLACAVLLMPRASSSVPLLPEIDQDSDLGDSSTPTIRLPIVLLFLGAFMLAVCARGFDIYVPTFLRRSSNAGLNWLVVLIIVESALLFSLPRMSRWTIIGASAAIWAIAYGMLLLDSSSRTFAAAMILAGWNCPAMVTIQNSLSTVWAGAIPQALITCVASLGGFIAASALTALATYTDISILWASLTCAACLAPGMVAMGLSLRRLGIY